MTSAIKRLHRFLADQSFYPILLATVYSMSLYIGRAVFSGQPRIYSNLVWNLFLAWIPYLFSMLAYALMHVVRRAWPLQVLPGIIWLLFFPNAPYILTDFFHLDSRAGIPLWYDMLMLIAFSWTGIFLMVASLRTMSRVVKAYLGRVVSWVFALAALMLSAIGIYLGRFERWNSWDMLRHPERILADVIRPLADPLNSLRFFGVTILFTIFLVICYLVFISFDLPEEGVDSRE